MNSIEHVDDTVKPTPRDMPRSPHLSPLPSSSSSPSTTQQSINTMIRHSISQIFQTNSYHEQNNRLEAEQIANMISGLGGRRPMVQQSTLQAPLNQQPSLPHATTTSQFQHSIHSQHPPFRPLSQIEAMPPNPPNDFRVPRVILDPATRHPVFFTDRLKKAPNGVLVGKGTVAEGYVFEQPVAVRKDGGASML